MKGTDRRPTPLQLRLLGAFDLRSGHDVSVTPSGRKVRALLACLALSPGLAWPREKLMALLWSERGDEQARASLRQALAELRRLLGEPSPIRTEHDAVTLDPALIAVDAVEFERLAKAGRLDEAAVFYGGPLLDGHGVRDDAFEEWVVIERTRLHDLAVNLLERLLASKVGEPAIVTAQQLLQIDPVNEAAHRALMRLYAAQGDRARALRQYQVCRDALQRELQATPDSETDRVHRQIQDESMPQSTEATVGPVPALPPDGKPTIAVLPFANLSGDSEQDYFSRGIAEDIITELSRFRELLVMARNSSFQLPSGAKDVGQKLGVQFVVDGSVRKIGNKVRVTVQLVDSTSTAHIWAERYDRDLIDIFEIQDEITRTVTTQIAGRARSTIALRARSRPTESLSAYDVFLQARESFRSELSALQAEPFLRRAIELDPGFADAHAMLSVVQTIKYSANRQTQHLEDALGGGRRALDLDPAGPRGHNATGFALTFLQRLDEAGHHLRHAVALNPNEVYFRGDYASWMNFRGETDGALREIDEALRRDPYDNEWFWSVRGMIETAAGRYADALGSFRRLKSKPPWSQCYQAVCHVELGQLAEARACLAAAGAVVPGVTPAHHLAAQPYADVAIRDRLMSAIRRADPA